jgi:hypothetical protein
MAFIPAPNTAQVNIRYLYAGQQIENTLYFHKGSAFSGTDLQDLADSVNDHWASDVMIDLSNALQMTSVYVVDLTTASSGVATHTESHTGSNSGSAATPGNVAFCLKFTTASRGRSFRGRIYLPGIPIGYESTPGILNQSDADTLLEDVQGAIGQIVADTGLTHVVVSRYSGVDVNGDPIPRATALSTPVTGYSYTDRNSDSQRRRLPGRGN